MTKALSRLLACSVFGIAMGSQAPAATMTFENLQIGSGQTAYTENGISVVGNGDLGATFSGAVHMDDSGTPSPSSVSFTMGTRFRAISFQILGSWFDYRFCDPAGCTWPTYNNLLVEGFRGGQSVISQWINTGNTITPVTYSLPQAFTGLTSLRLSILWPDTIGVGNLPSGYSVDCSYPCSHFTLDNVTLAPVPVPAALPLAASALAFVGFLGWLRRKSS